MTLNEVKEVLDFNHLARTVLEGVLVTLRNGSQLSRSDEITGMDPRTLVRKNIRLDGCNAKPSFESDAPGEWFRVDDDFVVHYRICVAERRNRPQFCDFTLFHQRTDTEFVPMITIGFLVHPTQCTHYEIYIPAERGREEYQFNSYESLEHVFYTVSYFCQLMKIRMNTDLSEASI